MKLASSAQAATRLAVLDDKAATALAKSLSSWFATQILKPMSLSRLRSLHQAGAYPAFADMLAAAPETDCIKLLTKLDKQRHELLGAAKSVMLAHIEALAAGRVEPTVTITPTRRSGGGKASKKIKVPVGILSSSKY